MCLVSKEGKKKAACDIVCYKVLVYGEGIGVHWTPFMFIPLSDAVVSGKRVYCTSDKRNVELCPDLLYKVQGGYIHVYKDVPEKLEGIMFSKNTVMQVYECVIKKGTEYWESYDGKELCARKIRFVRRVA